MVALSRLALLVFSILLGLLIAEGLVRVFMPQSVAVPLQDEINGVTAPRPNVRGRHAIPNTFDVTVSISSQRFRGRRDFTAKPERGVLRIAVLGDSFTFGIGANDDETYPAVLQQLLQERLARTGSYQGVEVLNAGVGGTGTGEQALWYEVFLSLGSLWEMGIKISLGRLQLAQPYEIFIPQQLSLNHIGSLGITISHTAKVPLLPFHHRDPFDRLLIAQALVDQMPIVSRNPEFEEKASCVQFVC
jgi:PIN domain nuclease of toxin-antitoxin system